MTMLEKVTRKIAAEFDTASLEMMLPNYRAQFERAACAAIEAMREPTDAMIRAGDDTDPGYEDGCSSAIIHWDAMIDAALNEKG